jgi:hypothetical protein
MRSGVELQLGVRDLNQRHEQKRAFYRESQYTRRAMGPLPTRSNDPQPRALSASALNH